MGNETKLITGKIEFNESKNTAKIFDAIGLQNLVINSIEQIDLSNRDKVYDNLFLLNSFTDDAFDCIRGLEAAKKKLDSVIEYLYKVEESTGEIRAAIGK